jgi:UrcA family protein
MAARTEEDFQMTEFLSKLANASLLALAALPLIALGVAHAQPVRINISDIDLNNPAQTATLDARIDQAAAKFCSRFGYAVELARRNACTSGIRDEALEQVQAIRAAQQTQPETH